MHWRGNSETTPNIGMVLLARFVVSTGSMKRYLVPHLLVSPVLTAWHCGEQLAFAVEYQNWQVHQRCPVLFTDESRFILSISDRLERVRRSRGEHYADCNMVQHDQFVTGSVMVL